MFLCSISLFRQLVSLLQEEKRHQEVLMIMEQYYASVEEPIKYAIECGQYKTALRLCSKHKMNQLKGKSFL